MAFMNQAKKQIISANLKPILKKYGVKATLRVKNYSSIVLTIKSGKINFFNEQVKEKNHHGYVQVNPYWFQEHYTGESLEFLSEAFEALKSADWYDRSEIQTDYFDIAYYYDINIGSWDKPYELKQN